jgi:pimeloyl-ACP methyl ester carboxylesterase
MGGAIAALLALQRPELVRGLVLVATPARFEIPRENLDTWHDVMRGRKTQPFSTTIFSPKTDLSIMREVWTEQVQTDPRVRYFDLLACNGVNLGDPLSRITVPTLVITGRDDHFAPPDKVQEVQKIVPNATMVVVDDAGHALTSEKPQEFHQAVDAFLQGLE